MESGLDALSCPGCKGALETGWLVTMTGLHWATSVSAGKYFVPNMNTDMVYPGNEDTNFENPRYEAARCKACGLLVAKYKQF